MAEERLSGTVALRLFFLLVGVLFIWNSIPSHRWTGEVDNNIQTGLWTTCSCVDNGFKDCQRTYSDLEKAQFRVQYAEAHNKSYVDVTNKDTKDLRNSYRPFQYIFRQTHGTRDDQNKNGRAIENSRKNNNNNNNNKHNKNDKNSTNADITKDNLKCEQYNGSGAIALISYIFAFFAVIVIIRNISSNVLPVLNGPVFGLIILSGIFGLIATCMFGDLFGHQNYPFGYDFGLFTTAWVLLLVVGLTGLSDFNKNVRPSESTSALRAALLVIALTAFAFSMGDNWYSHSQQEFLVPLGGPQWTIKQGTFFIEPFTQLGADSTTKNSIEALVNPKGNNKNLEFCDKSNGDNHIDADDYELHIKRSGASNDKNSGKHKHKSNHTKASCLSDPQVTVVKGIYEIGLWSTCYCKDTLSVKCSMFGSNYIMFDNKQRKCDQFNVARAMVLIVGILSLGALILSSALLGGLRRVNLHVLSNSLCLLASVLGLISSIIFGVLYNVKDLNRDYAIYLAGWILVFLAACLGGPVVGYYREVESAGKVVPLQPVAVQPVVVNP